MNERIQSQVQATKIVLLRKVHAITLRDKVRSCEIPKALNIEPHLRRTVKSQLYVVSAMCQNAPRKIGKASPAGYTHRKATHKFSKDQVE